MPCPPEQAERSSGTATTSAQRRRRCGPRPRFRAARVPLAPDRCAVILSEPHPMRYMMFIKHPGDYATDEVPESLYAAMGEFVEEQTRKGMFIDGAGLQPLTRATRVRLSGGKITVTD